MPGAVRGAEAVVSARGVAKGSKGREVYVGPVAALSPTADSTTLSQGASYFDTALNLDHLGRGGVEGRDGGGEVERGVDRSAF
jgi:hypothetical protein